MSAKTTVAGWLAKLESHGMVTINDEEITIISCRKSEG